MPRLKGSRRTYASRSTATPAVRSVEPSSTTTMSKPGSNARISSTTRPTVCSSFSAGTIAIRLSSVSCSATGAHRRTEADELEDLARAVRVRVLVEDTLARTSPHRLGRAGIGEQLAVRRERLVGGRDDTQLRADVEPPLDTEMGVGHDRSTRRRELERTARRRRVHRRVRAPRDVQVDTRARDGLGEHVEGHVADHARIPDVAAEVLPAEGKVDLRGRPAGLAAQRLHPLAAELVAVAVEENGVLLPDRRRLEELGVGGPEHRLGAARAELAQTLEPALGVRDDQVVLRRIRAVVVVEPR